MISKIFALVALVFFSTTTFAYSEAPIPELTGRAVFAGSVQPSASQKEQLISTLKNLESENKVQMAVLVVDSIKPLSIEQYSLSVAEKWKIGQKGVDNGVLLVVATQDKKARIEVGYGLESVLTDAMSKRIQSEQMIPYFKKGDFPGGIIAVVSQIKTVTTKEIPVIKQSIETQKAKDASKEMSEASGFLNFVGSVVAIFALVFGLYWWSERRIKAKEQADMDARHAKAVEDLMIARRMAYTGFPTTSSTTGASSSRSTSRTTSSRSSSKKSSSTTHSSSSSSKSSSSKSSGSSDFSTGYSSSGSSNTVSASRNDDNNFTGGGGSFGGGGASSSWD